MKRIMTMVVVTIILIMSTTGCGSSSTENIAKAFEQIESFDYQGALETISYAREDGDDERILSRAEGIALLGMGRYDDSISAFIKSLSLSNGVVNKMDYDINYYLATAYYKKGMVSEALDVYNSILAMDEDAVDALFLSGVLHAERGEIDLAMLNFDKAIGLAPDNYDMLIQIYSILSQNGYKDVGVNYLTKAMESGTKKMSSYEKGQISFYLEDYESARTYLEKAKDEKGYEAVLFLGKTYETLGDINYAISVYSSFVNAGGNSAEVLNQLGLCKMKMEDYEGALSAFQQAMNVEGNTITQTLKFNEIVAYEYMGDFKKACVLVESYLKIYPDDENAKREYIFLKTR